MEVKGEWLHSEPLWRNEGSLTSCVHKREQGQRGITSKYMTVMIRCNIRLWALSHKTNDEIQSQIFLLVNLQNHLHTWNTNMSFISVLLHLHTVLPLSCWTIGYWQVLGWGRYCLQLHTRQWYRQTPIDSFKPVAIHTALVKISGS